MKEVLKFGMKTCAPCKLLSKVMEGMENVTEVDAEDQPELAAHYGIVQIPTLVYLEDGVEYYRSTGVTTKDVIEGKLNG